MIKTTDEYNDPRWVKRKLEIIGRDRCACTKCHSVTDSLHVHHTRYLWGKRIWEYPDEYLVTLCGRCHRRVTEVKREIGAQIHKEDEWRAAALFCEIIRFGKARDLVPVLQQIAVHSGDGLKLDYSDTSKQMCFSE